MILLKLRNKAKHTSDLFYKVYDTSRNTSLCAITVGHRTLSDQNFQNVGPILPYVQACIMSQNLIN